MINLKNIAEGWAKHIGLIDVPDEERKVAFKRVTICAACPHATEMWLSKIIDGALLKDQLGSGIGCGICHCPVQQKALVMSEKCPVNKW